jgi:hypothetical protein
MPELMGADSAAPPTALNNTFHDRCISVRAMARPQRTSFSSG